MLRVLVVDSSRERAAEVCAALAVAGHQVTAVLSSALELSEQVLSSKPDVIFIQADSPSRDTLEHLAIVNRDCPRPVLMCSSDSDTELIRRAVKAGVSSYVVDSVSPERVDALMDVALAQFEAFQNLRAELDDAQRKLSERIVVDRAKGVLMKARGLTEEDAYHALRKLAMERGRKLADVAQDVLDMARLLM
ncbi:MAG TPA: ANTAR domain-containing protein [Zoogloea sp.]|uniref:ANTAR domain-containing response regulator n=1 Tax=Zoogloea sp. TaxID=49181 RepID=UPI002C2125E8|nr:ANTAR domain-containing protein [Zoogloea sp.]HMV17581.1 ANTAR domain-containing protein [Rhodocyclaceae bacterium]HMV63836.1 ANTAR domain-containing protein [Rhodocyclaceae bacterium]HMW52218.1 ANTAR domain-containing protein [Rhodocyclaceae bacterium]HMY50253.1 ANTAR domain-containing protein [Rhodocyclaceae bacterium]HMZ76940.1 ANTAR domain-containing protein [Rhodocyclaceae bacterium]